MLVGDALQALGEGHQPVAVRQARDARVRRVGVLCFVDDDGAADGRLHPGLLCGGAKFVA